VAFQALSVEVLEEGFYAVETITVKPKEAPEFRRYH
jgi:hypothetical protein